MWESERKECEICSTRLSKKHPASFLSMKLTPLVEAGGTFLLHAFVFIYMTGDDFFIFLFPTGYSIAQQHSTGHFSSLKHKTFH